MIYSEQYCDGVLPIPYSSYIKSLSEKRPVYTVRVVSKWVTIALPPDLSAEGFQPAEGEPGRGINEPNDHTIFQDINGEWRLWACVRHTRIGRIFCQWKSAKLFEPNWERVPGVFRCSREAGESRVEWMGQEFIQSPFVLKHDGHYWMFYGGYDTGYDSKGNPCDDYDKQEKQLCLMTSPDGINWTRYRGANNYSRVFVGPGAVRDPVVARLGNKWYVYYSGHTDENREIAGIYARSSDDLINWSDWTTVNYDPRRCLTSGRICVHESPYAVEKDGLYYLFRNPGLHRGTHIFVSDDPLRFGIGPDECDKHMVAHLQEVIAPELVQDTDGSEYITRINSPDGYRIQIARLEWVKLDF